MPDKSQTININYKFNTAEIDKAQAALNRANTASNKLQQDAGKGFDRGTKSVSNYGKSIAGLENQLAVLGNRVKLAANPAELGKWRGEFQKVKAELDVTTKSATSFGKATAESGRGVQSLVTGFRDLSRFAGLAILATLAKETVDVTLAMVTLQGQVQGVERGFSRAFVNSATVIEEVRTATHGTITDFGLMKRTLQATNLGVGVEHLGTLFEFAAARAQQTGESVDYLVDSIVRGIGRKSSLVLDNLGISVTALKEKFNGVSIASKTVGEATEGVAEIAKEQLEKMGGYVETAETRVKNLTRSWEEFKIALSKRVDSTGIIADVTNAIDGMRKQMMNDQEFKESQERVRAEANITAQIQNRLNDKVVKDEQELTDLIMSELRKRADERKKNLVELGILEKNFKKLQDELNDSKLTNTGIITVGRKRLGEIQEEKKAILEQVDALKSKNRELVIETEILKSTSDKRIEGRKKEVLNLEEMRKKLQELTDVFDGLVTKENKSTGEHKKKAVEIKKLRSEIEAIEALLKDPKELKIKVVAPMLDDALEKVQKFFDEGGGLKDVKFNASTGAAVDLEAINAKEIIDTDKIDSELVEAADHISDTFWTRLRLSFKGEGEGLGEEFAQAMKDLELGSLDILSDQLTSLVDVEANSFDARIRKARSFYEENMILAGNNEQAKDRLRLMEDRKIAELRKKQFVAEQKAAKQKALINGAVSLIKIWVDPGFPAAIPLSALIAGITASQISMIDRNQPRFAKGVIDLKGNGTGTSDSIPAWLSRGESVMTAWETKNAGGVLKDIRAKKLDDKVLRSLKEGRGAVASQFNDERIIKAIQDNRPPDVIEQSGIVYKGTRKSEDYINRVRAKSVRI